MKPFDLDAAKRGEPVITRGGKKVRIVCFDVLGSIAPLLCLVETYEGHEKTIHYSEDGHTLGKSGYEMGGHEYDLFMAPKTITMWSLVSKGQEECDYSASRILFYTKEEAIDFATTNRWSAYALGKLEFEEF